MWVTQDDGPAAVGSRAEPRAIAADTSTAVAESSVRSNARTFANLDAGDDFARRWQDVAFGPAAASTSFGDRFAFDRSEAALQATSLQGAQASLFFDDRFMGQGSASGALVRP